MRTAVYPGPGSEFLIAVAIGDAVWRTSSAEHGYITPIYEEDATRAVTALPTHLSA
jgi:hypothetical protein